MPFYILIPQLTPTFLRVELPFFQSILTFLLQPILQVLLVGYQVNKLSSFRIVDRFKKFLDLLALGSTMLILKGAKKHSFLRRGHAQHPLKYLKIDHLTLIVCVLGFPESGHELQYFGLLDQASATCDEISASVAQHQKVHQESRRRCFQYSGDYSQTSKVLRNLLRGQIRIQRNLSITRVSISNWTLGSGSCCCLNFFKK